MTNNRPENEEIEDQQSDAEKIQEAARASLSDAEDVEGMRARLYARGKKVERFGRSDFKKIPPAAPVSKEVSASQHDIKRESIDSTPVADTNSREEARPPQQPAAATTPSQIIQPMKKRKKYRARVLLVGLVFFVFALGFSSLLLLLGGSTISGDNISIDISNDQLTIGGGEELSFQASIANLNTVPIESATLIVNYPTGTQSAENPGQELFSERLQLNIIDPNEVVNVPIKAIIFGEENEEKIVNVAIEYRVSGSNATFYKDADPLRLKISSSPIALLVDSVERISSGQEIEFDITVKSNAPTLLSDILVKASYPFGFDFTESNIETASGQDTWLIEELAPEEEVIITVKGIVLGKADEERVFNFAVGVPNERDRYNLASTFSKYTSRIAMEEPFLDIDVEINHSEAESVVIETEEPAQILITFTNSQEDTLYDGVITATLEGGALNEVDVDVKNGHYDSRANTVRWDSVDVQGLKELLPGQSSQ
ncbi:hypothetical protein OAD26_00255, partial [bacterium]|nr:hypothetical protein [bacterium]